MQNNSQTYERLILPGIKTGSTCSQEVFPASRFQQPESAKEPKTTATCGPKCSELFGLFDPVGSWARTFTELLVGRTGWYSNRCVLTWKRKVTKSNRMYFQLAVSALPTKDTGLGLLPTAQTQGLKMCENGKTQFYPVGLLPTPTASSCAKGGCTRTDPKRQNDTLAHAIHGMIGRHGKTSQLNPRFVVEMMGFPTDWTELPFQSGEWKASKPAETR